MFACHQLAQSILKIGFALVKAVEISIGPGPNAVEISIDPGPKAVEISIDPGPKVVEISLGPGIVLGLCLCINEAPPQAKYNTVFPIRLWYTVFPWQLWCL